MGDREELRTSSSAVDRLTAKDSQTALLNPTDSALSIDTEITAVFSPSSEDFDSLSLAEGKDSESAHRIRSTSLVQISVHSYTLLALDLPHFTSIFSSLRSPMAQGPQF